MTDRVLTARARNRALLARQLLLERSRLSIVDAVEQVGGLQTQYSPSGYVGLWTRLASFRRDELTAALEARSLIQATLMRVTIHTVTRADFWPFAMGVREARRTSVERIRTAPRASELRSKAAALETALADGPKSVKELGPLAGGFIGTLGLYVDLVRVPPSGTWERRRADRLGLAESWVGPCDATEEEGLTHLVRACLRGFGPQRWADIAGWAGISATDARRGGANLALASYRDEAGRELVDLVGEPLPDETTTAPVRFLAPFDNALLVHFRATGILPEEHRRTLFPPRQPTTVGTVLVDGRVVASWTVRDDAVIVTTLESIPRHERDAVEAERVALQAFYA